MEGTEGRLGGDIVTNGDKEATHLCEATTRRQTRSQKTESLIPFLNILIDHKQSCGSLNKTVKEKNRRDGAENLISGFLLSREAHDRIYSSSNIIKI